MLKRRGTGNFACCQTMYSSRSGERQEVQRRLAVLRHQGGGAKGCLPAAAGQTVQTRRCNAHIASIPSILCDQSCFLPVFGALPAQHTARGHSNAVATCGILHAELSSVRNSGSNAQPGSRWRKRSSRYWRFLLSFLRPQALLSASGYSPTGDNRGGEPFQPHGATSRLAAAGLRRALHTCRQRLSRVSHPTSGSNPGLF
jgi:hypothetical protein